MDPLSSRIRAAQEWQRCAADPDDSRVVINRLFWWLVILNAYAWAVVGVS